MKQIVIVGHRGAAGHAPENTMASYLLGLSMKSDMLEIDVHLSKDGEIVVIHDPTLERTTNGQGNVCDYTVDELRQLDAGSCYSEKFAGQQIPTLKEVLDLCRGRAGILLEIKGSTKGAYPGLEQQLADQLVAANMHTPEANVIIQCFDPEVIQRFHQIMPDMQVGMLINLEKDLTPERIQWFSTFSNYFNVMIGRLTKEVVDTAHACGMKVFPWTVRNRDEVQPLLDLGVDGIIADYPDYVAEKIR